MNVANKCVDKDKRLDRWNCFPTLRTFEAPLLLDEPQPPMLITILEWKQQSVLSPERKSFSPFRLTAKIQVKTQNIRKI